jgi:hypothetical protein
VIRPLSLAVLVVVLGSVPCGECASAPGKCTINRPEQIVRLAAVTRARPVYLNFERAKSGITFD